MKTKTVVNAVLPSRPRTKKVDRRPTLQEHSSWPLRRLFKLTAFYPVVKPSFRVFKYAHQPAVCYLTVSFAVLVLQCSAPIGVPPTDAICSAQQFHCRQAKPCRLSGLPSSLNQGNYRLSVPPNSQAPVDHKRHQVTAAQLIASPNTVFSYDLVLLHKHINLLLRVSGLKAKP